VASAGSGIPQCAVIGWPGQIGQVSPAALSQTVNTKSMKGATRPFGWLPALYAQNFPPPILLRTASAMIDRAEFPVHRNSTL
jgi:hypothetical protein